MLEVLARGVLCNLGAAVGLRQVVRRERRSLAARAALGCLAGGTVTLILGGH